MCRMLYSNQITSLPTGLPPSLRLGVPGNDGERMRERLCVYERKEEIVFGKEKEKGKIQREIRSENERKAESYREVGR